MSSANTVPVVAGLLLSACRKTWINSSRPPAQSKAGAFQSGNKMPELFKLRFSKMDLSFNARLGVTFSRIFGNVFPMLCALVPTLL